jgi:sigma-E factor negative regulatory protein RseC
MRANNMLETRAIIVQLEGDKAEVETGQGGGCGHCDSKNGCGSGKVAQLFCTRPRRFIVRNDAGARVGDEVQITMADGALLRSAALMYLLPLALLLAGGLLGSYWADGDAASGDIWAASGALLGLLAGFALARHLTAARRDMMAAADLVISRCGNGTCQSR